MALTPLMPDKMDLTSKSNAEIQAHIHELETMIETCRDVMTKWDDSSVIVSMQNTIRMLEEGLSFLYAEQDRRTGLDHSE